MRPAAATRVDARRTLALALLLAPEARAQLPADWDARDLEGKWVAYQRDRHAHSHDMAERLRKWVEALAARRDTEFLEWLGIYEGWPHAGPALVQLDAPQWLRVAAWNLPAYDSHNRDDARSALRKAAAQALGWVERYPMARNGVAAELWAELEQSGAEPADPGAALPPLDGAEVLLAYLDAPTDVAEFGDRQRAERGVRYAHQVVRALRGLPLWGDLVAPHVQKIVALLRHRHAGIRAEAFAALTRLPGDLVPYGHLLRLADGDAPAEDRRQAAFALASSSHPAALFALLRIAGDPEHAARDTAWSRLMEVGDGFVLGRLAAMPARPPQAERRLETMAKRVAAVARSLHDPAQEPAWRKQVVAAVLRVAWAERAREPLASALAAHLDATAATLASGRPPSAFGTLRADVGAVRGLGADHGHLTAAARAWLLRLERQAAR